MCEVNTNGMDFAEVFTTTWPRARKPHVCATCRTPIQPGEKYLRLFMVHAGDVSNEAACLVCGTDLEAFGKAHRFTPARAAST